MSGSEVTLGLALTAGVSVALSSLLNGVGTK